jgi:hypothetical protein
MPHFFDRVAPYFDLLIARRFSDAIGGALGLLENFRNSVPAPYANEHKGTPFYVMGVAAFASRDYLTASLFFDAAVAEDIRTHGLGSDHAALRFMRLTDPATEPKVLGHDIVEYISGNANELISDYNARQDATPITLDQLRTRFLIPIMSSPDEHKRALVTAFITFVAEWKYRAQLIELIEHGTREPFFMHLFRGCLLFESLLKEKYPPPIPAKAALRNCLQVLHTQLVIPNNLNISAVDFDAEVQSLTPAASMTDAIQMTGRFRNTLGHNLAWPSASLNQQSYNLAIKNVAAACLHALSRLYH